MSPTNSDDQIAAVRLQPVLHPQARRARSAAAEEPVLAERGAVSDELSHREELAAKEIGIELGLDPGYLSRIVQKFDEDGLITRKPVTSDHRRYRLALTAKGRQTFASSNAACRTMSAQCCGGAA